MTGEFALIRLLDRTLMVTQLAYSISSKLLRTMGLHRSAILAEDNHLLRGASRFADLQMF